MLLAYIAYVKSVGDKYRSWRSLLLSLKADLESQASWLSTEYFQDSYKDKWSYSPGKTVYALSFESLKEMIRRGVSDSDVLPLELNSKFSIFYNRIEAFNQMLSYQQRMIANNPGLNVKLNLRLNEFGLMNSDVTEFEFENKLNSLKQESIDLYGLTMQLRAVNEAIHVKLIGNRSQNSSLSYLYQVIYDNLSKILVDNEYQRLIPWYIRYMGRIVIISFIAFYLIERFF